MHSRFDNLINTKGKSKSDSLSKGPEKDKKERKNVAGMPSAKLFVIRINILNNIFRL